MWIAIAAVSGFCVGFVVGYWSGHYPHTPTPTESKRADDTE